MSKTKIVSKGYTIVVDSWENDGDYFNTKEVTVQTQEEVEGILAVLEICKSEDDDIHTGNHCGMWTDGQMTLVRAVIDRYFPNHDCGDDIDCYSDYFMDIVRNLLEYSEGYLTRVYDGASVTYSPKDVYIEKTEVKTKEIDLRKEFPEVFL